MFRSYYNDTMISKTMFGRIAQYSEYRNAEMCVDLNLSDQDISVDETFRIQSLPSARSLHARVLTVPVHSSDTLDRLRDTSRVSIIDRSPNWTINCDKSSGACIINRDYYWIRLDSVLDVRCFIDHGQIVIPGVDDRHVPDDHEEFVDYRFKVRFTGATRFPQVEESNITLNVTSVEMSDDRFGIVPVSMIGNYYATSLACMMPKIADRPTVCVSGMIGGLTQESLQKSHALDRYADRSDQIDCAIDWHLDKIRKDIENAVR